MRIAAKTINDGFVFDLKFKITFQALLIEQRFQSAIETSDDGVMKDAYHIAAEQMKRHVGDWEIRSSLIKTGLDEQSAARIMRDLSDARSEEIRRRLRALE